MTATEFKEFTPYHIRISRPFINLDTDQVIMFKDMQLPFAVVIKKSKNSVVYENRNGYTEGVKELYLRN